jgi:hypothetical protein
MELDVQMEIKKLSREFEPKAVHLVGQPSAAIVQATCDLFLNQNVLRRWLNRSPAKRTLENETLLAAILESLHVERPDLCARRVHLDR